MRRISALALVAVMSVAACSQMSSRASYGPAEQAHAEELFDSLAQGRQAGHLDAAAAAGHELINGYPRFARRDEAMWRLGQVEEARGHTTDALTLYTSLAADFPLSAFRSEALRAAAGGYEKLDDPLHEAEMLLEFIRTPADRAERDEASNRLMTLAGERLSQAEVDALAKRYPDSAMAREAALNRARAAYARGDYDKCYQLVGDFLDALPSGEAHADARRLMDLAVERRQAPPPAPASRVNPDRVGLLFPQTGSLALYGRLFEQGARLAVDEHNASHDRRIAVTVADSRGTAVDATKGVRRLAAEDGAIAIVGDVFTLPAVAGAVESNAWRTPIVSPVVASDELTEIGPWIFQTRSPATVQATAVAQAAVSKLSLERFAILAPSRGDRRKVADFFAQEIQRLGKQVVAAEYFEDGSTDFKAQLGRIRDAAPDALFTIGTVDELLQILPQARFYDLHVQLLGVDQWNSDKLLRLARDEMEGALFPADSHIGATPEIDATLQQKLAPAPGAEASPVSVAGYYGMHAVIAAIEDGASSREDVRTYLDKLLRGDADERMAHAAAVPLLRVVDGKVVPFDG